jgi:hypothetical protein
VVPCFYLSLHNLSAGTRWGKPEPAARPVEPEPEEREEVPV